MISMKAKIPISLLLMIAVFLYPPLVFSSLAIDQLRIILFLIMLLYLMFAPRLMVSADIVTIFFLITIIAVILLITNDYSDVRAARASLNFIATLFFAALLHRYLRLDPEAWLALLRTYIYCFYIIAIGSILSFIFFHSIGALDLFGLAWDGQTTGVYVYRATPFGLLLPRSFFDVDVYRSFSFFIEPSYLGFFCVLNFFLAKGGLEKSPKIFIIFNFIAGFLTFSFTFIALVLFFFLAKKLRFNSAYWVLPLIAIFSFYLLGSDFFDSSSLKDRLFRGSIFIDNFNRLSVNEKLFGVGFFSPALVADRSFSSGFLILFWEVGLIGSFLVCLLIFLTARYKMEVFLFSLMGLLVFDITKFPLFWLSIIIVGFHHERRRQSVRVQ